jgi:predicted branched-subunit amino acid permease
MSADSAAPSLWQVLRQDTQHPAFWQGFKALLSASPGIAAWGLMAGVATTNAGLSAIETIGIGVVVFAGSAQLAALPLLLAGAPFWVILAAAFCVNLRFVVFSAQMRPYLMHMPLPERLFRGYLCADLTYMLFVRRFAAPPQTEAERREQRAYFFGNSVCNWLSWSLPSVAGIALAQAVPQRWGLAFAGTLALIGIMASLATTRLRVLALAVASGVAVAAYALPLKLNIVLAIGAAVAASLMTERLVERVSERQQGGAGKS